MADVKHTPGPWNVNDERGIDGNIYIEDALGVVAIVTDEANVRLLAAAPELLEVAQGILVDDMLQYLPAEYVSKVRAAIAKATGEAPFACKYCGSPSWIDPSDQSPPPDCCHAIDHAGEGL